MKNYKVTIWYDRSSRVWYAGILNTETDTPIDISQVPTFAYMRSCYWLDSLNREGAKRDAAILREWLKTNPEIHAE